MKSLKKLILLSLITVLTNGISGQVITLPACIDSALTNKGNIKAARTDYLIAKLQTSSVYQKYLPDLSFNYNYRYNPVIPAQIIPVGQFNPVPTDEKRAIKFGTEWQQNAGLTLYQPLTDFSIRSRLAESRINEKLKSTDIYAAETELKLEVIKTFVNIWILKEQLNSALLDTTRSFSTKELLLIKYQEGKVLKTDVNKAILNHNNTLSDYAAAASAYIREKLYLSFLTGITPGKLLENSFDFSPLKENFIKTEYSKPLFDSIPSVRNIMIRSELTRQQQRSEKMKNYPILGFDGFLGTVQYTDSFKPFLMENCYGNSYLGLNLKFRILSENNTGNRIKQLKLEQSRLSSSLDDEINNINNKSLSLIEDIKQLKFQAELSEINIRLYEENLLLNRERFEKGQLNVYDLLNDEIDFRKEQSRLNWKKAELIHKQIDLINNTGSLSLFIETLR